MKEAFLAGANLSAYWISFLGGIFLFAVGCKMIIAAVDYVYGLVTDTMDNMVIRRLEFQIEVMGKDLRALQAENDSLRSNR